MSIEPELWGRPVTWWEIREDKDGQSYVREHNTASLASSAWEYAKGRVQRGATFSCTLSCYNDEGEQLHYRHVGG